MKHPLWNSLPGRGVPLTSLPECASSSGATARGRHIDVYLLWEKIVPSFPASVYQRQRWWRPRIHQAFNIHVFPGSVKPSQAWRDARRARTNVSPCQQCSMLTTCMSRERAGAGFSMCSSSSFSTSYIVHKSIYAHTLWHKTKVRVIALNVCFWGNKSSKHRATLRDKHPLKLGWCTSGSFNYS